MVPGQHCRLNVCRLDVLVELTYTDKYLVAYWSLVLCPVGGPCVLCPVPCVLCPVSCALWWCGWLLAYHRVASPVNNAPSALVALEVMSPRALVKLSLERGTVWTIL